MSEVAVATASGEALTALYDALARYQWWLRRCRRATPGEGLEMHKVLAGTSSGEGAPAGAEHLHGWLWRQTGLEAGAHVLDVGCGFGATLFHWARHAQATGVGITGSPYQVTKARSMARAMGLAESLEFACQQFDTVWPEHGQGWHTRPFDLVYAVEALGHSADLPALLVRMAARLRGGGRLLLLEDMAAPSVPVAPTDPVPSEARRWREQLCRRWSLTHVANPTDYRDGLLRAGCEIVAEHDLTDQVRSGTPAQLNQRERRLLRLRRLAPGRTARGVLDAFLGGIDLERLYSAGAMQYRLMVAVKREGGA